MAIRGVGLMIATLVVMIMIWCVYNLISDGLAANMMMFESEPSQGWNYWRWYFIKRSLKGILTAATIFTVLAGLVIWGWILFVRDIIRSLG